MVPIPPPSEQFNRCLFLPLYSLFCCPENHHCGRKNILWNMPWERDVACMKFGIAFCGVCGIASVGVLTALSELGMDPCSIFINDNSILPVYLYTSGLGRDMVITICQQFRTPAYIGKKGLDKLSRELRGLPPPPQLYVSTRTGDYTNQQDCFPKAADLSGSKVLMRKMIDEYTSLEKPPMNVPETWPLTCMNCERILLISSYCCKVDGKCNLHIRLPAYDRKSMTDLRMSFFQGYRAAMHAQKKIYEKLLF